MSVTLHEMFALIFLVTSSVVSLHCLSLEQPTKALSGPPLEKHEFGSGWSGLCLLCPPAPGQFPLRVPAGLPPESPECLPLLEPTRRHDSCGEPSFKHWG